MIRFHVDDVMSSHINSKVTDNFDEWLTEERYTLILE